MSQFVPGQRWLVDPEPDLGLGIVLSVEGRAVTLAFPLAECERIYTVNNAPLTRMSFDVGDTVALAGLPDESRHVKAVQEDGGVFSYQLDDGEWVAEIQLAHVVRMNQPFLRLLTGQLEKSRWFAFRRELDKATAKTWRSGMAGFFGARTNLIPHQLYVAWSACAREEVRVLLADEVGLGKTIEAGLILSRLLRYQRVKRVLICVPEALQVQWLVEMRRRFNIFLELHADDEHDFEFGQCHLIAHHHLPDVADVDAFDLVIVDEVHQLQQGSAWFDSLRSLADASKHLVLLSATPEQLGLESHFARLQLLDSARYSNLASFQNNEAAYAELNKQVRNLPASKPALVERFDLSPSIADEALLEQVLDCHGTGRVMFRNTRASVSGFTERQMQAHTLNAADDKAIYDWLAEFARSRPQEKILVITHLMSSVKACEAYLWQRHGVDVAVFHEEMSLLERDRAAAYFAEIENGSQLLLCSEIGSEGRNFQFCHHLVCLDLPEDPDVLEQRIGRLDRIGQVNDVQIHVPVTEQNEKRLQWYHEALNCIEQQSPAATTVHQQFWSDFDAASSDDARLQIAEQAKAALTTLEKAIREGRDALLELNSCREPKASALVESIAQREESTPFALVESASDLLHFHFEDLGSGVYSLIPADNMLVPALPGIPPEGAEVVFERHLANAREDALFLSWDAPFIIGLWDMLNNADLGSASVALLPHPRLPAGRCLLEGCFEVLVQSPVQSDCIGFLETLSIRAVTLDISDKNLSEALPEASLEASLQTVEKKIARQIVQSQKTHLSGWYDRLESFANDALGDVVASALAQATQAFSAELSRMKTLQSRNPNVSDDELHALKQRQQAVLEALSKRTTLRLSAVRLIVVTEANH